MDFYSFKAPMDINNPDAFSALTQDDLISYGPKCALPVKFEENEYRFSIPETCRITAQSGIEMTLSSNTTLSETLTYSESGTGIDGAPIFEVPGGRPY